ncbi:uncharacterized protein Z520_05768 [Fonsecaea multimorphosa CBS 102226]|uniref:Major facilitator superfamily (MFS) profile domain-containing protein n=1 Tax=Fonsecaea multimorphosa CBS 102226 TaxID=1442371 RepID=A0A0D2JY74_9EURO|nr:uncharacterized protein Z520_05768 [Fonsecaea multimorphosa CBS 102226]KIX98467.1 hypothetical protein Z520_05768 [Fonsecaea multimorphosa CBS 102226]OAL24663.1 hypothetical protein AYO22_05452 [Fonsecaea multimorphosa]
MASDTTPQLAAPKLAIGSFHRGEVGKEQLDPHIYDDHGDPHRAALEDAQADAQVSKSTWAAVFFLAFTLQSSLSFALLTVFPVLVPIALELQHSTKNVNWMASGWSLAASISITIAGQLSDYFGRRYVLLFGQGLLILGHVVGATAQSVSQGIAAMVILGCGTGTSFVFAAGISEILPNKYRSVGMATTEANLLPFSTFGPLIARSLVVNATWRWIFYLGIITGVIALVGTAIFYNPPSHPFRDRTRRQVLAELDYLGIFLYTAGITLFLMGLEWAGNQHPWHSAAVIAPVVLGACLFIGAFVWDFSGRPQRPIFPWRLFRMWREYLSLLVIIFVTGLVYISTTALIPQQINDMFTSDSIKAGYYNIPAGFGASIGGTILGGLIYKIRHVHWQLCVGIAVQTLFIALFALITPDRIAMALVFQCMANIPFGWILLCCYTTAGLHVPQRDIGLAFGLIGCFRFLGGAVGTTVFSTILSNRAATTIPARVVPAVLSLGWPAAKIPVLLKALLSGAPPSTLQELKVPPTVIAAARNAIRHGYSDAFKYVWYASIPFGVMACIFALFVIDPSAYFTTHVAVKLEKERLERRTVTVDYSKSQSQHVAVEELENVANRA